MPGRYQTYAEYKDSGVEWLGKIPDHWATKKIKYLLKSEKGAIKTGPFGSHLKGDDMKGGDFKVINQRSVIDNEFTSGDFFVSQQKYRELIGFKIFPEDILVTTRGTIGRTAIAPINLRDSILHPCLMRLQINRNIYVNELIALIIQDAGYFLEQLKILSNATTIDVIYSETLKNVEIAIPQTIEEQVKILQFLYHETDKIDTLIEKQQQLIKLLKEKRQAVISHAVTKGLNPQAPMKESGVEWLGNVPEHWGVKRIGLLFTESNARASSDAELVYPVLSVSIHHGISDKELNEEELDRKITRSEDKSLYKIVHNNDLAYNMMRAWQGGFGASKLSGLVSPAYVVCKPKTSMNSYYFELALRTPNAVTELKRYSRGITDFRLRLYWDEFKNIHVPIPPPEEIDAILISIKETNSKYDRLISVAVRQITLLQERRTALISAAVTGKIDVRNWQAPEQTQTPKEAAA